MIIGGLQKTTLIDYPGKIAAIVFTSGCNMNCGYCHNPELRGFSAKIDEEEFLSFLDARKGKLEAVTVTGGEPTVQRDLFEFIGKIKSRGFLVKLDTQGTNPRAVERLLSAGLVDYVAMDIKAPLDRYREVANCFVDEAAVRKTIGIIMSSAPDYEFRTTIVKGQLGMDDMRRIGELIKGAKCHYSQKFVPNGNLNDPLFASRTGLTDAEMEETRRLMSGYVTNAFTR